MNTLRKTAATGFGLLATTALLVGCSTKSSGGEETGDGSVKTDFGVVGDTLTVAALTDQSGPYAALGSTLAQGNQLYFDQRNADGGVCGFDVEVEVRDHGNDVQTAVSQFSELEPNVLGFTQLLGSPQVNALKGEIESKTIPTFVASWSSDFLGSNAISITGTIYPYDIINGLSVLADEGTIEAGSTVGHVHLPGDFGENALKGSEFYAEQNDLEIVDISVEPTATDYSAQVQQLVDAKVDAIIVSGTPPQLAGIVGGTSALGLDVPVITQGPSFGPALLETAAADAIEERVRVVLSYLPYGAEGSAEAQAVAEAYAEAYPDGDPTIFVNYGYATANVFGEALDAACEAGDLTRQGVTDALRGLAEVETGIFPTQSFQDPATSASTQSVVLAVDPDVTGGLVVEKEFFESELVPQFTE
ncbi:ABC transporter substrate-binding protein [Leucobacter weissii]|uniref:ABC transporter substrate-binding protein n=1 Tax=Leucobacter weissii TaxID=1983706 RepID=A0A939S4L5_9MICO|nr:ABC transporter substrate-binding protein [Leucobacter weissii]MBO1900399.1 ABC transporter substrate-binding protein [Leucobacter weissii]